LKKSGNITIPINAKWKLNNKKDSCVTIPADAKWMLGDKKTTYNTIRKYKKRETITTPIDTIVRNIGIYNRRLMIGTATLGTVRIEWVSHRKGQIIPINWKGGEVVVPYLHPSVHAVGYQIADAQNVIAEHIVSDGYEWLLLWEDDVLPPFDALLRIDEHIATSNHPIVAGLYYTKSDPSWPLVFKGSAESSGCFTDFKLGDQIWVDGVCTGFTLIHSSIIKWMWENSPRYTMPDGKVVSQVFETPRRGWIDPETSNYFTEMGTSDLTFCKRIIKENVFAKTGWKDYAKKKYPFLVDTRIFCHQIDPYGRMFPISANKIVGPKVFKGPTPKADKKDK